MAIKRKDPTVTTFPSKKIKGITPSPTLSETHSLPGSMIVDSLYDGPIRYDASTQTWKLPNRAERLYAAAKKALESQEVINNLTGVDKVLNATEQLVMSSGIPQPQILQTLGVSYGAYLGHWAGKKVLGSKRKAPSWLKYTPFENEGGFIGAALGAQLAHEISK